jgi:hypothetical protein
VQNGRQQQTPGGGVSCQTPECLGCKKLKRQNRQLCNKIIDLKLKIQDKEAAIQKQKGENTSTSKAQQFSWVEAQQLSLN